jgi:hypothetical protein
VVPFSDGFGSAPVQLERTAADAVAAETGARLGGPSAVAQLAHLAFPLAAGEQGVLNAQGLPAVLVAATGERPAAAREGVSAAVLEGFGRGVLSTVDALDSAPDVPTSMQTGILVQRQAIPAWAVRLLVAFLLLGPLLVAVDWFARLRRRREPVGRWISWTLACALPFFACALFVYALGWLNIVPAAPAAPVASTALPVDGQAVSTIAAAVLVLGLAWLLWPALTRRLGPGVRPESEAAGLALVVVLLGLCLAAWTVNPFAALLLVPGLHLSLLIGAPQSRPRPAVALVLVAVAMLPFVALVAFYASQLGLGAAGIAWTAVLLLVGGHVGVLTAALWSIGLGCAAAAAMLCVVPSYPTGAEGGEPIEITVRGPLSYAGPGSLGGTESTLRR